VELLFNIIAPHVEGYRLNPLIGFDVSMAASDDANLKRMDDAI